MKGLELSKQALDHYFKILNNFSTSTKKRLIVMLTESIEGEEPQTSPKIDELYGAWQDDKSADEIVNEIKESRTYNREIDDLQ